jgi:hypothetical protein
MLGQMKLQDAMGRAGGAMDPRLRGGGGKLEWVPIQALGLPGLLPHLRGDG